MKQKINFRLFIIICMFCFASSEAYSQAGKWSSIRKGSTTQSSRSSVRNSKSTSNSSGSTNVAYLDILQKYAPFYYKRKIISSERIQDNDYQKQYRYYDSFGFQINVNLMRCGFCQGGGKNPYNGQFCGGCFGQGWKKNINAWNKKTSVCLDCDGNPVGGVAPATASPNTNHRGSSSSGKSSSSSIYTTCRTCKGSGVCTSCDGRGTSWKIYGGSDNTVCPSCNGNRRCYNCHGSGRQ